MRVPTLAAATAAALLAPPASAAPATVTVATAGSLAADGATGACVLVRTGRGSYVWWGEAASRHTPFALSCAVVDHLTGRRYYGRPVHSQAEVASASGTFAASSPAGHGICVLVAWDGGNVTTCGGT